MTARINAWRKLEYTVAGEFLRQLRAAEASLLAQSQQAGVSLDPLSLRLRTSPLKAFRELRDAALFSYGMGLMKGVQIGLAPFESEDYDAVTTWVVQDQQYYCPLQLNELPPADLNPNATLSGLLSALHKYPGSTDTVLAIKLSQKPDIDLVGLRLPNAPFAEVHLFWADAPDSASFAIYGDLKQSPGAFAFAYPT